MTTPTVTALPYDPSLADRWDEVVDASPDHC